MKAIVGKGGLGLYICSVYNTYNNITITNSVFTNKYKVSNGISMYSEAYTPNLVISNSIFTNNGLFFYFPMYDTEVKLSNVTISNNTQSGILAIDRVTLSYIY